MRHLSKNWLLFSKQPLIWLNGRLLFCYRKNIACGDDQQDDRIHFAHIRSPPFGGKIPPRDDSRPRRSSFIISNHIEKANVFTKKPAWHIMPNGLFRLFHKSCGMPSTRTPRSTSGRALICLNTGGFLSERRSAFKNLITRYAAALSASVAEIRGQSRHSPPT